MSTTKRHEVEVNIPIERMWCAMQDMPNLVSKVVPEGIKSMDKTEDGIVTLYFTPAIAQRFGEFVKEKVEYIQEEKKLVTEVLDGVGLGKKYSSKKTVACLKPGKTAGSTIVAWEVECEPVGEDPAEEAESCSTLIRVEKYLIEHPDLYA